MDMIAEIIMSVFALVLGLLFTFWGYKKLKKLLTVSSALITFCAAFMALGELGLAPQIIISLVLGIIAGVLAHFFFLVGIFCVGASFGAILGVFITTYVSLPGSMLGTVITVFLAVLFGVFALKTRRIYLSFVTAYTGAYAVCFSLCFLISAISTGFSGKEAALSMLSGFSLVISIATIILGLIGFIIQLVFTAPRTAKK